MRFYSDAREAEWNGWKFVIRDVLTAPHPKKRDWEGPRYPFAGWCQYATKRADGCIVWKPCEEGSAYADLEPFVAAA